MELNRFLVSREMCLGAFGAGVHTVQAIDISRTRPSWGCGVRLRRRPGALAAFSVLAPRGFGVQGLVPPTATLHTWLGALGIQGPRLTKPGEPRCSSQFSPSIVLGSFSE